jgi:hypothetical protein
VFPVRYELNFHILFRRNSVFEGLKRQAGRVEHMGLPHIGENRNAYKIYVRNPEGKKSLRKLKHGL